MLSSFESSPSKLRRFCSTCGTHLLAERSGQQHVVLRLATLDDDPGVRPSLAIWTSHDVPWLGDRADLARYAEWEPDRVPPRPAEAENA